MKDPATSQRRSWKSWPHRAAAQTSVRDPAVLEPRRRTRFRSWYLALAGTLVQAILGFAMLGSAYSIRGFGGVAVALIASMVIVASALGVIPLILLIIPKTRRVGGYVSIIFGIAGLALRFGLVVGVFLLAAGIIAAWKRV